MSDSPEDLITRLFSEEVPEIASGVVQVRAVARTPGVRTKVAVSSSDPKIDPVVACVGPDERRVRRVQQSIDGEAIDIFPWSDTPERLIKLALAPASVSGVDLQPAEHRAVVHVVRNNQSTSLFASDTQRELASRLTGWAIAVVA